MFYFVPSRSRRLAGSFSMLSFVCFICFVASNGLLAQDMPSGKELETTILEMDRVFWKAYNECDVEKMMSFVGDDVEFYHDKGGVINTRTKLAEAMNSGLCRSGTNEVERRPVAETIKVFPIAGVGAILSGQHTFQGVKEQGDDGIAYFFHLWKYSEGSWKMTRVFSYDHAPLAANRNVASINLSSTDLAKFTGNYEAPNTGKVTIKATAEGLSLFNGNESMPLKAKSATVFFNEQLPLEFKFSLDDKGEVTKFAVYEKGVMVEEAVRAE